MLIFDNNEEMKINKNDVNDGLKLMHINHYLGINFPPIPFLWHYDDFAQPFPIHGIKKISIHKLRSLTNIKNLNLFNLNDKNCDVYILAQYKKEKVIYNETTDPNEIYISYHSWLYNNLTKSTSIKNIEIDFKFRFLTSIIPIVGELEHYNEYPFKNNKKKSPGGISIGSDKLIMRNATIHRYDDNIKFSGINVCNFNQQSDNCVFLSIMSYPHLCDKNNKDNKNIIKTISKKSNCIVLHIFRNVYDNNPNNNEYQELINKYMAK